MITKIKLVMPIMAAVACCAVSCSDKELYYGKTLQYTGIESVNYDYKRFEGETSIREEVTQNFQKIRWDDGYAPYDDPTTEEKTNPNKFLDGCTSRAKKKLDEAYTDFKIKFSDRKTNTATISQGQKTPATFKVEISEGEFSTAKLKDEQDIVICEIQPRNIVNNRIKGASVIYNSPTHGRTESAYRTKIYWTEPVGGYGSMYFDIYAKWEQ